jgi:hypothetical protein
MLTNTHAISWSGEKISKANTKPRPKLVMTRFL